jgi:hypothetical protein
MNDLHADAAQERQKFDTVLDALPEILHGSVGEGQRYDLDDFDVGTYTPALQEALRALNDEGQA